MGEVFRAEDLELGRNVAIKVVKASFLAALSDGDAKSALQRFLQEARAAAALSHPGVTTVHRVGTVDGCPYIAMEWLEGRTLEQILKQHNTLDIHRVARVGLQVLSVLEDAHRAGIVHRDIKPANLILTSSGRIKVADFGIARVQGSSLDATQQGIVLCTPQYAAPEQLAGLQVDARVDLYSLGVVLFEAFTGRPPFKAASLYEFIALLQSTTPPLASSLVSEVPPAFDQFLQKALATVRDQRFTSASEMAVALQPFLTPKLSSSGEMETRRTLGRAQTLIQVPTVCVEGTTPLELVGATVRTWPSTDLKQQELDRLLVRVLEKPVHTEAFCGAIDVSGTVLLVCDGILFAAFVPSTGVVGDLALETLPPLVDATLFTCPSGLGHRTVMLLASLLFDAQPRLSGLDASFVDVSQLAAKLTSEAFEGALRFVQGSRLGFALFSRGKRVLDVFGHGWPEDPVAISWEEWLAETGAIVSVEDRRTRFPSLSFRRELRNFRLDVLRESPGPAQTLRTDARAEAASLRLQPVSIPEMDGSPDAVVAEMIGSDPVIPLARWILADLAAQFEQFQRTNRWKAMIEPLSAIKSVRLHGPVLVGEGHTRSFDAAFYGEDEHLYLIVDRVTAGTRAAVVSFVEGVVAAKQSRGPSGNIVGAVLVAPSFTDDGLAAYLDALNGSRKRTLWAALEFLSHREGFLTLGRSGFHILLVEENEGRFRPLVPEN